jgi:hypothetical protein
MTAIGALATIVSVIVAVGLASPDSRSGFMKFVFGSSQTEGRPKPPEPPVIPIPTYPQAPGTIAGLWNGTIFYLDGRVPKPFTFMFEGVGCRGRGDEPNTFGDSTSNRLQSILECGTNTLSPGQTIIIKKTYNGTAGATHTVMYKGTVSSDVRKISGEWSTPHSLHGSFILQR